MPGTILQEDGLNPGLKELEVKRSCAWLLWRGMQVVRSGDNTQHERRFRGPRHQGVSSVSTDTATASVHFRCPGWASSATISCIWALAYFHGSRAYCS